MKGDERMRSCADTRIRDRPSTFHVQPGMVKVMDIRGFRWLPLWAVLCALAINGAAQTVDARRGIACDSAVDLETGPRYYLRIVDEWSLFPPWDHFGEPAAMILSTERPELRPGKKLRIEDGDQLLIYQRGMPTAFDTTCLGRAWAREGGFISDTFWHGRKRHIAKRSALGKWRVHCYEWSNVRFLTAQMPVRLLQEVLSLDMMCLDLAGREFLPVAIALPTATP
jgi:hypothetical protein